MTGWREPRHQRADHDGDRKQDGVVYNENSDKEGGLLDWAHVGIGQTADDGVTHDDNTDRHKDASDELPRAVSALSFRLPGRARDQCFCAGIVVHRGHRFDVAVRRPRADRRRRAPCRRRFVMVTFAEDRRSHARQPHGRVRPGNSRRHFDDYRRCVLRPDCCS